jgi:exopolysaccharide biosynthesis protein
MKRFFSKPGRWAAVYSLALAISAAYILLYTFVLPRAVIKVTAASAAAETTLYTAGSAASAQSTDVSAAETALNVAASAASAAPVITDTSYSDGNISIVLTTERMYDTDIYIADITVSNTEYLKTAFALETYGRNIKAVTSSIAAESHAILAINGDYYGFRDTGFVLRNGVLYRDTARAYGSDESLAIDSAGNFTIFHESRTDAQALLESGVWQVLSFGPALIDGGVITVTANSEVAQSMGSNPRTAIGQVSALHYIMVVSDGRTSLSTGLSLEELAQVMLDYGCAVAYNLDGGGSSTLWFIGQVINHPTDGRKAAERSVSDIVCIGY